MNTILMSTAATTAVMGCERGMTSRHSRGPFLLILVAALTMAPMSRLLADGPFVLDSGFADAGTPVRWSVPADTPWHRTDADGHSGNDSLKYTAASTGAIPPVTQVISLPANADLVLAVAMKIDGAVRPVARLRVAGPDGAELVRIVGEGPPGLWRRYFAEFSTGPGGKAVVELWADIAHLQSPDRSAPAGTICLDDIQVISQQEAEALRAERPAAVIYENLARGMAYTLHPTPGYPHCTDPDDGTQLTDGQYTVGYFWTQKSTVGWVRQKDLVITVDLGDHHPIRGLSFSTAAGVAGVNWPSAIEVLVSVDGRAYHSVGDLVAPSAETSEPPAYGDYALHRFRTAGLRVHGRYVKLLVSPVGNCTFVDEIEVYRGDEAWKQTALPGAATSYPPEYFDDDPFMVGVKRRVGRDLETVRSALEDDGLPAALRPRLDGEIEELAGAIRELPATDAESFRGVVPFNSMHERVYGLLGAARAAGGHPPVVAWSANPWDFLTPTDLPASPPPPTVSVAAMKGETRADALNLTNCTAQSLRARLTFEGLPGAPTPEYVDVAEVAWTDTPEAILVAAALPEVTAREGSYEVSLPAGMTRQVWLSITPRGLAPGTHHGHVVISGVAPQPLRVPIALRVFDLDFPQQPRLHVGGWDYTNSGGLYGVTRQNRSALIAHLQSRYVDSPWATRDAMPYGEFDATGQLIQEPSTANFDAWVQRWPKARRYHVFCRVDDNFAGTKIGDPLFGPKVGAWISFWVAHLETLGISADRLFLLLRDESQTVEDDNIIIAWSRAIKAAEPRVAIWDDGTRELERNTPELLSAVDFLCPHRPSLMADPDAERLDFYRSQSEAGKGLCLYSCWGPTRTLDPYAYYRLQAWSVFDLGGEGSFFWAFGSTGGGHSWNAYVPQDTAYTPLFLGHDFATPGKHMEAIRESVGDFEYLAMLRDAVAGLEQRQPDHRLLRQAEALLAGAADRVLTAPGCPISEYHVSEMRWRAPRDREQADAVRGEIGELLEKLK